MHTPRGGDCATLARALKRGTRLGHVIKLVQRLRRKTAVPILLMGYCNPLLAYGLERFARDLKRAGGDACLDRCDLALKV